MDEGARVIGGILILLSAVYWFRIQAGIWVWRTLTLKKIVQGSVAGLLMGIGIILIAGIPLSSFNAITSIFCFPFFVIIVLISSWLGEKNSLWLAKRLNAPSSILITKAIMTSQVDEKGFPIGQSYWFKQNETRIYCCVTHKPLLGGYLGTKLIAEWFYEDRQINRHSHNLTSRRPVIMWIESSRDGIFQTGHYRVELFVEQYNKNRVKTVEFMVS